MLKNQNNQLQQNVVVDQFLTEKVNDFDNVQAEKERLAFENDILRQQLEDAQKAIKEEPVEQRNEPLGPVLLVFCGGSFLQEKSILAPPTMLMGNVIDLFCDEISLRRLNYSFYTKDTGKKIYVDDTKTAHENGFINGSRILYEKVENNKLWGRGDNSAFDS